MLLQVWKSNNHTSSKREKSNINIQILAQLHQNLWCNFGAKKPGTILRHQNLWCNFGAQTNWCNFWAPKIMVPFLGTRNHNAILEYQ